MRMRALATAAIALTFFAGAMVVPTAAEAVPVATLSAPPYPGVLEQGSTGRAVAWVQKALIRKGYSIPSISRGMAYGYYDVHTAAAVYRFKRNHPSLGTLNGKVGPRTYAALVGTTTDTGGAGGSGGSGGSVGSSSPNYTSLSQCSNLPDSTPMGMSSAQRKQVPLTSFVRSKMGCKVVVRESGGDCRVVNSAGYYGKWQLDMQEWPYYGGTKYASMPHYASCAIQDAIAYRNWLDRGWSPWTTAY